MKSRMGIINKYYPAVKTVVDATKNVTFQVTAEDSRKGNRKESDNCALAEACKREYDGAIISRHTAYLIKGTRATRYEVPEAVAREIVSFDRHHDFAPGTYKLNRPTPSNRIGADPRPAGGRDSKGKSRAKIGPTRHNHLTSGMRIL